MFFEKCEKKKINEAMYEITNATQVEIWNCKQLIVDIYNVIDPSMMEMSVNPDSYLTWKKDLIKQLKEFDKLYMKHIKSGFVEMNVIHTAAMKPLIEIMAANYYLNNYEQIEKKKDDLPTFRGEALREKYCQHMNRLCEIFRDFGTLKDVFNIKQTQTLLMLEGWQQETPLAFYLAPLQNAVFEARTCLLKMYDDGPLHCSYIIEENKELQDKSIVMIQKDGIAQWLAGDDLK